MVRKLLAVGSAFLLVSCGSDKDADQEPVATATPAPTPAPSPTPSPTPAPTPTPTSSAKGFDALTGVNTLRTVESVITFSGTTRTAASVSGAEASAVLTYDAGAKSYTVTRLGTSESFAAAEIDASAPAGTTRYVKANNHSFTITRPVAGAGLDYVRFADYRHGPAGSANEFPMLTGVITPVADLPSSGTVTYARTMVAGDAYITSGGRTVAYSLGRSTMTVTVDFSAQSATTKLVLVGTPKDGGADVALITVEGSVDFDGDLISSRFSATDFSNVTAGTFAGVLFGPQAAEAGLLLSLTGSTADSGKTLVLVAKGAAGR